MKRPILVASTIVMLAAASEVLAWEYREFVNADGVKTTGVVEAASNTTGVALAIGCEGDQWRHLVLLPTPPTPMQLSPEGRVRVGFGGPLSPASTWRVRNADGIRAYFAPSPSALVRQMVEEERKSEQAAFDVEVWPAKSKALLLRFPLGGLSNAIRKHLWEKCKLDIYLGDPPAANKPN